MQFNILYLHSLSHFGGGETTLYSLLTNLDSTKFKKYLVLPKEGPLAQALRKKDIGTYIISFKRGIFNRYPPGITFNALVKICLLAKKLKINLIHLNDSYLVLYGGIIGRLLGIPVVLTAHGRWDAYFLHQDILNQIFVDRIIAVNDLIKKDVLKRGIVNTKKVIRVYLGIDTKEFSYTENKKMAKQKLGILPENYVVTIIGRFDYVKDHMTFLETAEGILKEVKKIRFLIVGEEIFSLASEKNIKKEILNKLNSNNELKEKVDLLGFRKDIPQILSATDVLICSSLSESFGISLIEAMSCGVPVVSTNTGGPSEIITDGIDGFLVPPRNANILSEKVLHLLKNTEQRIPMGKKARTKVLEKFSIDSYVEKIQEIYLNLLH